MRTYGFVHNTGRRIETLTRDSPSSASNGWSIFYFVSVLVSDVYIEK